MTQAETQPVTLPVSRSTPLRRDFFISLPEKVEPGLRCKVGLSIWPIKEGLTYLSNLPRAERLAALGSVGPLAAGGRWVWHMGW